MPVPRPRTRLVNFRVSDDEYEILRTACVQRGARSISDFARLAVLGRAGTDDCQAESLQWRLSLLGRKMTELEGRLGQALRLLGDPDAEGFRPSGWRGETGG